MNMGYCLSIVVHFRFCKNKILLFSVLCFLWVRSFYKTLCLLLYIIHFLYILHFLWTLFGIVLSQSDGFTAYGRCQEGVFLQELCALCGGRGLCRNRWGLLSFVSSKILVADDETMYQLRRKCLKKIEKRWMVRYLCWFCGTDGKVYHVGSLWYDCRISTST